MEFGFYILDQSYKNRFLPSAVLNYVSPNQKHFLKLTIPNESYYLYSLNEDSFVGGFVHYQSTGYLMSEQGDYYRNQGGSYLKTQRLIYGTMLKKNLSDSNWWLQARLGAYALNEEQILNSNKIKISHLQDSSGGTFVQIGLVYGISL